MKNLKVVLTGGPCGGKTTSINSIVDEFTEKGYKVIVVPEAATILINSGIRPFGEDALDMVDFQRYVMDLQIHLESLAERAAKSSKKPTIILCDRGLMDDQAYVSKEDFKMLLVEKGLTKFDVMNSYDLVLHLVTAANGKEEFYTLDNNGARTETKEEAREKDRKTLDAWLGHDNLKIIGNATDFETKINNCIREVYNMTKTPYPVQRQEKYLVESFDLEALAKHHPVKQEIEQYITIQGDKDIMYRKTVSDQEERYSEITKNDTQINNERITIRRNITEAEFLGDIPTDKMPIKKTRYCFDYQDQYFRLDIFDDGLTILEIEETNKTNKRNIPDFIKVRDIITNDVTYRNSTLFESKNANKKKLEK